MNVVLASSSPRRASLLRKAGVRFRVAAPPADPPARPGEDLRRAAVRAAESKCRAVSAREPGALVVAADTLVEGPRGLLGKPSDPGHARRMLVSLSGAVHTVLTAVSLESGRFPRRKTFTVSSRVRFKPFDEKAVDAYLEAVDVMDKAGAYAVQESGDLLGAAVEGSFTNVVGLPVEATLEAMREMGWLRIGSIRLENPFLLGGLAGYGDAEFRLICKRCGAGGVFTPMMLDEALTASRKRDRFLPSPRAGEHPVFGQIVGADPETMAAAARVVAGRGFDGVDVNLACPAPKVLRRGRGGRLLADPGQALAILRAVREAVDVPVTAKLRNGFDETPASREKFWTILAGAASIPLDGIILHPRTVTARYGGRADRAVLAEAVRRFPGMFLAGSGDLLRAEDALGMLDETGADAAAFGRGAVGNPWIFSCAVSLSKGEGAPSPGLGERASFLRAYAGRLCETLGEKKGLTVVRKTAVRASRFAPHARRARIAFATAKGWEDFERALDLFEDPGRAS